MCEYIKKDIEQLYEPIKDLKTKEEFMQEIQMREDEYDHLFDEQTLATLIVDELGRNTEGHVKINDLHPGIECTVTGMITSIAEPKTFQRKNGGSGKLGKCILTDETGSVPLILWNEDVGYIEKQTIKQNTMVTIINGYTKKGYNGLEVNVGRWSKLEISDETHTPKSLNNETMHASEEITGTIQDIQPTTIFFKDDGTEGFLTKITLNTQKGSQNLMIWDKQVKHIQQYKKGEKINIKHIDYRLHNGNTEIHVNGRAIISKA